MPPHRGRTTLREPTVGSAHAGGRLGSIRFNLGEADPAEMRVQWLDGVIGPWPRVEADTFVIVERDASAPRVWSPDRGLASEGDGA
jgi:hypothetical protein